MNAFVKTKVLPFCTGGNGPRSVLVMDNASSHRNKELIEMCHEADVLLAYLPPYLPDFNPIETLCSLLKRWIKRYLNLIDSYTEGMGEFGQFLHDAVGELANDIEHDTGQLFCHSGIQYP